MAKTVAKKDETKQAVGKPTGRFNKAPVRLWVRSKFLGFRRNRDHQHANQSILKLEGVNDSQSAKYYLGKRCVFIYKAPTYHQGSKFRTIWGRIGRVHGSKGAVIARFSPNMPARAIGATVRVMLYPNKD